MAAGLAALASLTAVGIASGAPSGDDTHAAAVASVASGSGDSSLDQALNDRAQEVADRSLLREPPASRTLAQMQHERATTAQAAAEAAEHARVEAEQRAAADRAAAEKAAADQAAATAAAAAAAARPQAPAVQAAAVPAPAPAPAPASGYVRPVPGAPHGSYGRSGSLWSHGHTGEDFSAGMGTSVKAVAAGTVVKTGWGGAYGNEIVIRHADGKYTQYGHLSKFSVSAGQRVTAGQQIALSGSTGNSTGPHLHFEVRTGPNYGSDVNPIAYLRSKGVAI
jgi:murein DD-endopeptidase MepM/ murein hydrolase activator NlpD